VRGQHHALAALYTRERPGTHCTGDWVGPKAGPDRCGKSRPHQNSIPGPSSPGESIEGHNSIPLSQGAKLAGYGSLRQLLLHRYTESQSSGQNTKNGGIRFLWNFGMYLL